MKERLTRQLEGFFHTPLMWKEKEVFGLCQFRIPTPFLPCSDTSIESKIPSIKSNFVLGKRMESFLELQLKHTEEYKLLNANIQIHREKITLGELDFLIKDLLQDQVIHLEMVYKFYVYDPALEGELEGWIGPNRKDTFLQKAEKIKSRQFPLLYEPETCKFLHDRGLNPTSIVQKVCFKANLFVPLKHLNKKFEIINKECITGYWLHLEEFSSGIYSSFSFFAPRKQDWPVNPKYNEDWISYSEILKEIKTLFESRRSPLIWMKRNETCFERFFVVWW